MAENINSTNTSTNTSQGFDIQNPVVTQGLQDVVDAFSKKIPTAINTSVDSISKQMKDFTKDVIDNITTENDLSKAIETFESKLLELGLTVETAGEALGEGSEEFIRRFTAFTKERDEVEKQATALQRKNIAVRVNANNELEAISEEEIERRQIQMKKDQEQIDKLNKQLQRQDLTTKVQAEIIERIEELRDNIDATKDLGIKEKKKMTDMLFRFEFLDKSTRYLSESTEKSREFLRNFVDSTIPQSVQGFISTATSAIGTALAPLLDIMKPLRLLIPVIKLFGFAFSKAVGGVIRYFKTQEEQTEQTEELTEAKKEETEQIEANTESIKKNNNAQITRDEKLLLTYDGKGDNALVPMDKSDNALIDMKKGKDGTFRMRKMMNDGIKQHKENIEIIKESGKEEKEKTSLMKKFGSTVSKVGGFFSKLAMILPALFIALIPLTIAFFLFKNTIFKFIDKIFGTNLFKEKPPSQTEQETGSSGGENFTALMGGDVSKLATDLAQAELEKDPNYARMSPSQKIAAKDKKKREFIKQIKTKEGKEALLKEYEGTEFGDQAKALVDERTKVEVQREQMDLQKDIKNKEFSLGIVDRQIAEREQFAKKFDDFKVAQDSYGDAVLNKVKQGQFESNQKNLARLTEEKNKLEGELNRLTATRDENRNIVNNIQQQNAPVATSAGGSGNKDMSIVQKLAIGAQTNLHLRY